MVSKVGYGNGPIVHPGLSCFQTHLHVTPTPMDPLILPCDPVQCDLREAITHSRPTYGFMAQKLRAAALEFESPNAVLSKGHFRKQGTQVETLNEVMLASTTPKHGSPQCYV